MADPNLGDGKLIREAIGTPKPPADDPAWADRGKSPIGSPNTVGVFHREIPIVTIATGWTVPNARSALMDLVVGLFDAPGQLADDVMGSDSRTQAALASRQSILGRPVDFRPPVRYRDSRLAQECLDAWSEAWPTMAVEAQMGSLNRWSIMMGFGLAQLIWDTTGDYAIPRPLSWHPRYTYFHWLFRCFIAITMDGQEAIIPGDGSWVMHAPHGEYRGWMRGGIRAVTPWWLGRHYALRDWMRYSERHGLPMIKAKTPAVGEPKQQAAFRAQLSNLGQEAVFHLPQNPEPFLSYDVELLEARDTAHEGFRMLIEQCDVEITLALMAQTLTTAMPAEGGSSYAAARVHGDVRQSLLESDARSLAETVYMQIARPFAAFNFGNADLAPRVVWDVTPYEDALTRAKTFQTVAGALLAMRNAGYKPRELSRMLKTFQLDLDQFEEVEPLQIEAQAARAGDAPPPRSAAPESAKARAAALHESGPRRAPIRRELSRDAREALGLIREEHSVRSTR